MLDKHTHTHKHTQRQASKSMYHARHLLCSYGVMIATTTHETFAALALPLWQVHGRYAQTQTHTHTDMPARPCTTQGFLSAVTAKLLKIPRTRTSLDLSAQSGKSMWIYTNTHTQRQAGKSIYAARPLDCSYGEMIATNTHETFAAHMSPQQQVHITYTHTHRDRSTSPCTTHGPLCAVTAK
jgi:hypothetical protein